MRRILWLVIVCLSLEIALVGCSSPLKKCVTFRGQEICTGDSEQSALDRLGTPWRREEAKGASVVTFLEQPIDFGWVGAIEIRFSRGTVRSIMELEIEFLPDIIQDPNP
jgi:hypothetical protein